MSKITKQKEYQGFSIKPKTCSNCKNFKFDSIPSKWNPDYLEEKNLRCTFSDIQFKVGKTNYCGMWQQGEAESE